MNSFRILLMKKRKRIVLALFIVLFVTGSSCKKSDWFDIKSDNSATVPSTLQDFEYLLDNFFIMNQGTPGLAEVGSDGHYMPESNWGTFNIPVEQNAYTWTNRFPYVKVNDWNKSYQRIFQCNLVLEGLKQIDPKNTMEREAYNRIKGNALFHRAKNYYDLSQIYGQPYKEISASDDIGIPLKEGIDVTEKSSRSSVKQTYDRIIADLLLSVELLPSIAQLPSRGAKVSAFALLSRTFLIMGVYDKAGAYADSSLKIYNKLIDFNTVSATANDMGRFNQETIFFAQRSTDWPSTWLPDGVFVEQSLFASYDNNDLRKTRFFSIRNGNISFKGNYNNSTAGFDGLATDEQYLIKAECLARAGNVGEAMGTLNLLLKSRWNNTVLFTEIKATGPEDALRKILDERKKELLFRNIRWSDLRRLNLDSRFRITISRTIGGENYILEPDSYKYTLPLPDDVIALSGMQQNPGWAK